MRHLLEPSIVIKSHPPNLSVKPRSLQPLMLLPREHLSLSCLDLASPYGRLESSRSFESNIKILDLEGRMGARAVVLIARLETDKSIYAIERQQNGLYSLCHVGSWVDLDALCDVATVSCAHLLKKLPRPQPDSAAPEPLTTPVLHREQKQRRLAIEAIQSLVKRPPRTRSVSALSLPADLVQSPASLLAHVRVQANSHSQSAQESLQVEPLAPTADVICDNLRIQYLEALYHSKGSLAYFAKGPLSRARAAFHLDCDSILEMNDLIDILKGLVLTTMQVDKKYRETLPNIISKMKTTFEDSDIEQSAGTGKTRKRKSKKMKLGKDSLYPNEEDHVRRWWAVRKPQPIDDDMSTIVDPQETKLQVSLLRSRETQLQMIIILEILALEPLRTAANAAESQLPGLPPAEDTAAPPKEAPVKKRSKHNFPFLLDVHADRLCIWQSTALDEVKMLEESHVPTQHESQKSLRSTSDPLKDFCVDIIVPFFSSRLPEQCDSINRKLGGPIMISPPKPRPKKSDGVIKSKAKPGTAAKRPALSKPSSSRTLDRVLSKESERNRRSMSRGPSTVIALMRSASTPTLPMLKREASESSSVMSVPRADSAVSQEKPSRAPSSGPAKGRAEDRAKKDAYVKAELQDAISSLRKPNRDVVGKAIAAEAAERRATTSLSQLKKARKPMPHPRFHDVVKATPKAHRFRDPLAAGAAGAAGGRPSSAFAPPPYSSATLIPSSAPRKRNHNAAFAEEEEQQQEDEYAMMPRAARPRSSCAATTTHHHHVEATPHRRSSALYYRSDYLASSSAATHHRVDATPARRRPSAPRPLRRDSDFDYPSAAPAAPGPEPFPPDEGVVLASSPVAVRKSAARLLFRDSGLGAPSSSSSSSPPSPPPLSLPTERREKPAPVSIPMLMSTPRPTSMPRPVLAETPARNTGAAAAATAAATAVDVAPRGIVDGSEEFVAAAGKTTTTRKMSIFERLGWDNEDDDLL
ncbi:DNA replication regulator SLD3-domain-containing protein [Xylariaceae sp. FL0804]|nr:DNA replication regulator SLD3-domain-containing protein [Xylariaceae sp. FL0804]